MININLIAEKKQAKTKTRVVSEDSGNSGQSLLLVGILIIGLVAAGGWWWTLNGQIDTWKDKIEKADAELKRLEEIRRKNEEFKARKELLARKIDLITELKKKQAVPVHIMDQVSKNLPDYLWLDSMSAASNLITITGKATSYNAVSSFYDNLSEAGYFAEVTLGRIFEVSEGVQFSLNCKFAFDAKATGQEEDPQG
jgi:Tfp pilus assembly protein PilN